MPQFLLSPLELRPGPPFLILHSYLVLLRLRTYPLIFEPQLLLPFLVNLLVQVHCLKQSSGVGIFISPSDS